MKESMNKVESMEGWLVQMADSLSEQVIFYEKRPHMKVQQSSCPVD